MVDLLREHGEVAGWLLGLSAIIFAGTLIVTPFLVVRMRSDYFLTREPPEESWGARYGALKFLLQLLKNTLGIVLMLAGMVFLLTPGQGVLTILIGLSLLSFPGKRQLELRLVRQRPVLAAINWIRERAHRPPLKLPEPPSKKR